MGKIPEDLGFEQTASTIGATWGRNALRSMDHAHLVQFGMAVRLANIVEILSLNYPTSRRREIVTATR